LLSKVAFIYTSPEYYITDFTLTDFPTIFHGNEVISLLKGICLSRLTLLFGSEFDDEVGSSTIIPDNVAQADSVTEEVTDEMISGGTDPPAAGVVFDDAPPMTSDNGRLIVHNRNLSEVSISGSGRNGATDIIGLSFSADLILT